MNRRKLDNALHRLSVYAIAASKIKEGSPEWYKIWKKINSDRALILSEFDRLNAEIERLKEAHPYRWYQELIDDLNSEIELMQQENMYSDDGGDDA